MLKDETDNVIQFPMHRVRKSKINPTPVMPPVTKQKKIKEKKKTEPQVQECSEGISMLNVEMPDGSLWELNANIIATKRAEYAADNVEEGEHEDDVYLKVYAETLFDDDLLIAWAEKNLKWENVVASARMIRSPLGNDYTVGWLEGMKRIVRT